jgi:PAS domain S-box-containing protein
MLKNQYLYDSGNCDKIPQKKYVQKAGLITIILAAFFGLYLCTSHNFLLFHSLIEIATVFIGFTLFVLTWNTRHYQDHSYLKLLGIGYAFIALIDLVHTLAYKGMHVFPGYDANLPTQLWIAARYLQACTLAAAFLLARSRLRDGVLLTVYASAVLIVFLVIFTGIFPDCYIQGQGLTPFKINSEYLISAILFASLFPLYRLRKQFQKNTLILVFASISCTILSELSFTTYISVYSSANALGHFLKFMAFYLLYRAVVVTGLKNPYDLIFKELTRAKEEQQEMANEIRLLLESTGEGIIGVDLQGRCTFINKAGAENLGFKAEEITGRNIHRLVHHHYEDGSEYPEEDCPMNYTLWKGNNFHWYDDVLWRKDGTCFRAEYSSYPVIQGGKIRGGVIVFKDITERMRIEKEQQKLNENLTATLKAIPDQMFEVDKAGYILDYRAPKFMAPGTDLEVPVGRVLEKVFPPEAAKHIRQAIDEAAQHGHHSGTVYSVPGRDGLRWREVSIAAKGTGKSPKVKFILLARDITTRKVAEDALRQAKEEWEMTFDSVPDLIAILDKHHRIVRANRATVERLGSFDSACVGANCFALVHGTEAPPQYCPFVKTLADGKEHQAEFHDPHLGGDFLVSTTPLFNAQGELTGIVHVARDVTEHKRIEKERRVISKLESTGILAGGIAHDFNNLLSVILGNLDLIDLFDQTGESISDPLAVARKASLEARAVTQQLITMAKGGEPVKKRIVLSGLFEEQMTFSLRGSKIVPEFLFPADLQSVEADAGQITQVIRNLVLNAREAMSEQGVLRVRAANKLLTKTSGVSLPPGDYVKVSLTDQGEGIPDKILNKIFDPYFSTKQRGDQKGMGLGLTICRSIIQKHGGVIAVDTYPGRGTTFHIYLPASEKPLTIRPALPKKLSGTGRILVMDDEEMVRCLTGDILSQLGYEFQLAENGEEAIEHYQAARKQGRPFDAAILDLTVAGGMGGRETIQELLSIDPAFKVIASSGYDQDPVIQNYSQYGFKAALPKPYQIREMQKILCGVVGAGHTPAVGGV